MNRGCACLRQPLSQSASRRIASSPHGEPFGAVQTRCTVPYPFAERSFQWGYGGCRGPKGRNRNLPRPPCKKDYKEAYLLFVCLTPSVSPTARQLPRQGAFWVQYKHSAQRRDRHPTLTTSAPIFSINARSCSTISMVGRFFFISSSSCMRLSRSM